jgi:hypothetical protein
MGEYTSMFVLAVLFVGRWDDGKCIEHGEPLVAPVSPLLCLPPRLEEVCNLVGVQAFRAMRLIVIVILIDQLGTAIP